MEFPKASSLVPDKKYVITFDGLVFVGLHVSSDKKHHFEDVYGMSNEPEKVSFGNKCTFYGPIEPEIEIETILQSISDLLQKA
jgi:hypothetical protein